MGDRGLGDVTDYATLLRTQLVGGGERQEWLNVFKLSFCPPLLLDRHFMGAIESRVRIGEVVIDGEDEEEEEAIDNREHHIFASPVDGLRLALARETDNSLDFRQLPVALSRLYFSSRRLLRRTLRALASWQLDRLDALATRDQFPPLPEGGGGGGGDGFCDTRYTERRDRVGRYLTRLLDLCLLSFETCLTRTIEALLSDDDEWYSGGLFTDLQTLPYWRNLPGPHRHWLPHHQDWRALARQIVRHEGHAIWLVVLWRCNVTLLLERLVRPWRHAYEREWLQYRLKLFRDTHLDLMTRMAQDDEFRDARVPLTEYYPSAHRVCCAEEMPDFIRFSMDNFKTGPKLKERNTLDEKFGHLFINKTSPNICKIRNSFDISIRYGEEAPIIYEALKNILRCVLLGNVPRSRGQLSALARIKINASFQPEEADRVISDEVFHEISKNKSLKRPRKKKKKKKTEKKKARKKSDDDDDDETTTTTTTGDLDDEDEDEDEEEDEEDDGEEEGVNLEDLHCVWTHFKVWLLLDRHFVMFLLREFRAYIAESSGCFDEICNETYKGIRSTEIVRLGNARCRDILSRSAHADRPFDWRAVEFEDKKWSKSSADIKSGEIRKFHHWALKSTSKIRKDEFMKIIEKKMTAREKLMPLGKLQEATRTPFYALTEEEARRRGDGTITLAQCHFLWWYMAQDRSPVLETRWFQVMGMTLHGLAHLRNWLFCYYTYDVADNSFNKEIDAVWEFSMRDYLIIKLTWHGIRYYRTKCNVYHLSLQQTKRQLYAARTKFRVGDYEPTPAPLCLFWWCRSCLKFANIVVSAAAAATEKDACCSFLSKTFYCAETGRLHCLRYVNPHTREQIDTSQMQVVARRRDGSIVIESSKPQKIVERRTTKKPPTTGSFFFCAQQVRAQNDKKLDWLMQTSAYETIQQATIVPETEATAAVVAKQQQQQKKTTKRETKKKLIECYIEAAMVSHGITCQAELIPIDMAGIVKNGRVLCAVCGLMTEARAETMLADGAFSCGCHDDDEAGDTTTTTTTTEQRGLIAKVQFHPLDLLPRRGGIMCHYCPSVEACVRLAVIDDWLALRKIALCRGCFEKCRHFRSELSALRVVDARMGVCSNNRW